jgi:hypothetical protein
MERHDGFHASTARAFFRIGERDCQDDGAEGWSPGGIGSSIRMIEYFISRRGKNLNATRRAVLERAKPTLQRRAEARKRAAGKKR